MERKVMFLILTNIFEFEFLFLLSEPREAALPRALSFQSFTLLAWPGGHPGDLRAPRVIRAWPEPRGAGDINYTGNINYTMCLCPLLALEQKKNCLVGVIQI